MYTLPGVIFDVPVRIDILQRVVRWQLAKRQQVGNQLEPLHCTPDTPQHGSHVFGIIPIFESGSISRHSCLEALRRLQLLACSRRARAAPAVRLVLRRW